MKIDNNNLSGMPIITLLFIILFIVFVSLAYISPVHRWGDASTYYMMIDSISHDWDIKYESKDIQRAFAKRFDDLPAGLFLVKDHDGNLFYGKDYAYSLLASPFYWLIGNNGILVLNSIMFFIMILLGYLFLKSNNSEIVSFLASLCFFVLSTAGIYIFWIHAEIYILLIIMLGFFIWSKYIGIINSSSATSNAIRFLYLSAIIFGVATFSKMPNFIGILPIILYELYFKRWKNAISATMLFLVTVITLYGIYFIITGNLTPYNFQYYYVGEYPFWGNCSTGYGYPVVDNLIKTSVLSTDGIESILINLFYYTFGRFTGAVWYYPFIIIAVFFYFRDIFHDRFMVCSPQNLWRSLIFAFILLNIFAYLYLDYDSIINYFGGQHAVGNRYFYIYPAFLFLINKIKFDKINLSLLVLTLLMSALFVIPLIASPISNSVSPMEHTLKLPYILLPLEYSQLDDLPLWNPSALKLNNDTFYFPLSNICPNGGSYLLCGMYTEILIKLYTKNRYDLNLISLDDDRDITIRCGKSNKNIKLKKQQMTTVDLPCAPAFKTKDADIYDIFLFNDLKQSPDNDISFIFSRINESISQDLLYYYGWNDIESWSGIPTRWMQSDAILVLSLPNNRTANLSLRAMSFMRSRTLMVYAGNDLVAWAAVPTSFVNVNATVHLAKGANAVRLHVAEGCDRPIDFPQLNNIDDRCLSLAIQNITIT